MADNPLKAVVKSIDDLEESVQGLYDRQGDGTYALNVEGSLPGFVEKGRVDEFREANIKLTEETKKAADALSKFDGVDVDKYRAWEQSEADVERKNLIEAGQVEELIVNEVAKVSDPLKKQIKALESGIKERDNMLSRKALDEEILKAANAANARPGAEEFLVAKAKEEGWTTLDGKAVQMDGGGTPVFSDANPGLQKTIPEWVEETTHAFDWAFAASSGGGATGSATTAPNGAANMLGREDKQGFQNSLEDIASGKTKIKPT